MKNKTDFFGRGDLIAQLDELWAKRVPSLVTCRDHHTARTPTRLSVSTYAVNQHIDVIRKKLGAANRTEAVAIALRKHLLKI